MAAATAVASIVVEATAAATTTTTTWIQLFRRPNSPISVPQPLARHQDGQTLLTGSRTSSRSHFRFVAQVKASLLFKASERLDLQRYL